MKIIAPDATFDLNRLVDFTRAPPPASLAVELFARPNIWLIGAIVEHIADLPKAILSRGPSRIIFPDWIRGM